MDCRAARRFGRKMNQFPAGPGTVTDAAGATTDEVHTMRRALGSARVYNGGDHFTAVRPGGTVSAFCVRPWSTPVS